jgi:uncharacterized protein YdeI (YjbR/CyaY-like superfamily)
MQSLQHITVKNRKELCNWLKKNHGQTESIWLITYKKCVEEYYLPYPEIVKEGLCWGWIDSTINTVDAQLVKRLFSPRKAKSTWSKVNKIFIEELIY